MGRESGALRFSDGVCNACAPKLELECVGEICSWPAEGIALVWRRGEREGGDPFEDEAGLLPREAEFDLERESKSRGCEFEVFGFCILRGRGEDDDAAAAPLGLGEFTPVDFASGAATRDGTGVTGIMVDEEEVDLGIPDPWPGGIDGDPGMGEETVRCVWPCIS